MPEVYVFMKHKEAECCSQTAFSFLCAWALFQTTDFPFPDAGCVHGLFAGLDAVVGRGEPDRLAPDAQRNALRLVAYDLATATRLYVYDQGAYAAAVNLGSDELAVGSVYGDCVFADSLCLGDREAIFVAEALECLFLVAFLYVRYYEWHDEQRQYCDAQYD